MTNKLITNVNDELWRNFKLKCYKEDKTIKAVIEALLKLYADGKVKI